jgi:hypothetical protein
MRENEARRSPAGQGQGEGRDEQDRAGVLSPQSIAQSLACGNPGCPCGKRAGKGWTTHCPAHADDKPSLNISDGEKNKLLVKCFGGCAQDAVLAALTERGLWPTPERTGLTVEELAAAKGLPVAFLRELGVRDGVAGRYRDPCVDIPYCDEKGEVRAVHKRLRLTGEPRFIWRKGDHVLPYGLTRLQEARAAGRLVLVEGDSDCWTCWNTGVPALGVPGANTWRSEWTRYLEGITNIYVWREPDAGGDTLAPTVAEDIPDVRIIEAPPDAKDASALHLQDKEGFTARMRELMDKARPASQLRAEALGQEAREAFAQGRSVLEDPALLDRIGDAIRAGGFVGNLKPARLVYIAITSRLLPRPMNLALIAPSAAGKNKAIDAALELMPPSAYHLEGAGSARALIYGDADYQHKIVIVAEADSIPEDGPAASAVRALATDNRMEYDVVERDSESGKFRVRHIVKAGPTGLITTSIKPLGEQLSTRLLTVGVADTPEQTRAVLAAHAAAVNGDLAAPDVKALVAAQRWLELAGDRQVVVPYAQALARAVPAELVRLYDGKNTITVTKLTGALRVHRSTVWRRAQSALDLGFLINTESRKNQPAQLIPGAPLPEEGPALPLPEDVVGGCLPHPETDATVQPDDDARYESVSDAPVAHSVAEAPPVAQPQQPVQQPMQRVEQPISDTKTASEEPPVAPLHASPDEEDTPTTDDDVDDHSIPPEIIEMGGQRHYLVALAAELGFPNIHDRGGGIPAGRHYYEKAARYFSDKDVARAITILETMAQERSASRA